MCCLDRRAVHHDDVARVDLRVWSFAAPNAGKVEGGGLPLPRNGAKNGHAPDVGVFPRATRGGDSLHQGHRTGDGIASRTRDRAIHAFPAVDNAPSNALCRKLGFTNLGAHEFEYPPGSGQFMRCNDWVLEALADEPRTVDE